MCVVQYCLQFQSSTRDLGTYPLWIRGDYCMLRWFPFYSEFIGGFLLNFIKSFFCISWDDHLIFGFHSVNVVCITLIGFHMLDHSFISGVNPTWSWCIILFMCCRVWPASSLLRILVSVFLRNIGLWFSFLAASLADFSIRVMLASQDEFGSILSNLFGSVWGELVLILLNIW